MGSHYEELTSEKRAAIMMMWASNCAACHMSRSQRCSPSTITRELARFANWTDRTALIAGAPAEIAACAAVQSARRERFKRRGKFKLASNTFYYGVVRYFLDQGRSPSSQIAGTTKRMWTHEVQRTVQHESVNTCIYAMSKSDSRTQEEGCRGQMPDLLNKHVCWSQSSDRAFLSPWTGDHIKGAGNRSAMGVLVKRSFRLVMLIMLADETETSVLEGFATLRSIAEPVRQTLAYDQCKEMVRHDELMANTGMIVHFCGPRSPCAPALARTPTA